MGVADALAEEEGGKGVGGHGCCAVVRLCGCAVVRLL
jgi:hypothetical protein